MSTRSGQQFLVSFFYACFGVLFVFLVFLPERALGGDGPVEVGQGCEVAVFAAGQEDLSEGLLIVEHLPEVLVGRQRWDQQPGHFLRIHLVLELLLLLNALHYFLLL